MRFNVLKMRHGMIKELPMFNNNREELGYYIEKDFVSGIILDECDDCDIETILFTIYEYENSDDEIVVFI